MHTAEKDLSAFNSNTRTDHYWRSVFEIKTICENSKYVQLQSLVKAFLALQNSNRVVERSLSDNSDPCYIRNGYFFFYSLLAQ